MGEDKPSARRAGSESAGLVSRFFGVLSSPKNTFEQLVESPGWLDMLTVVTLIMAIFVGGFLSTEVGQRVWLAQTTESLGPEADPAQIDGLMKIQPYLGYIGAGQSVVMAPLMSLLVAGILYVVFSAILGAPATFTQLFSVVVHSSVIGALQQIFTWPLNYLREAMTSPTTLAVFFPMLDENTYLFRFLNAISCFFIWWIVVLSIGLNALYKSKTKNIALVLFAVYGLIALAVAALTGES